MSNPFKVGDKVTPVDNDYLYMTQGNVYVVTRIDRQSVHMVDDDGIATYYHYYAFKLHSML